MTAESHERIGIRDFLGQGRFLLFVLVESLSQLGDRLNHLALVALLAAKAQYSPIAFSEMAVYFTLPNLIFGPISGVLADRVHRKYLLVAGDLLRAALVATIPFLVLAGVHLRVVFGMVFVIFTIGIFYSAARMAVIPMLLPDRRFYLQANAWMNILGRLATLVGVVAAGVVIDWPGWRGYGVEGWAVGFWGDALTYLIAGLVIALLPIPSLPRKTDEGLLSALKDRERTYVQTFLRDLGALIALVRRRSDLRWVMGSVVLLVAQAATVYTLGLVLVQQVYGYGTRGLGFLGGMAALGMVLGGLMYARWGGRMRKLPAIYAALAGLGLTLGTLTFPVPWGVLLLLGIPGGIFLVVAMIAQDTLIHERIEARFHGRVFSLRDMLLALGFLGFSLIAGVLGEMWGPQPVALGLSGLFIGVSLLGVWRTREG